MLHGASEPPPRDPGELLAVATVPAERPGRVVVEVVGPVDQHNARLLQGCVQAQLARRGVSELIVDMEGVSFLGVRGLSVLIAAQAHSQRLGITLSVRCNGARPVLRPLQLTGLARLLCLDASADGGCRGGVGPLSARRRRRAPWA